MTDHADLRATREHAALLRDLEALCRKYTACTALPKMTIDQRGIVNYQPGPVHVIPEHMEIRHVLPDDAAAAGITYIAGPMTGYDEHNWPAFNAMAKRLRDAGLTVINPAELHPEPGSTGLYPWDWYLRRDITELVKCARVVFLPGWFDSKGARLEHRVAAGLGLELVYPPDLEAFIRGAQRDNGCRGCGCADENICCRDRSGRDHA